MRIFKSREGQGNKEAQQPQQPQKVSKLTFPILKEEKAKPTFPISTPNARPVATGSGQNARPVTTVGGQNVRPPVQINNKKAEPATQINEQNVNPATSINNQKVVPTAQNNITVGERPADNSVEYIEHIREGAYIPPVKKGKSYVQSFYKPLVNKTLTILVVENTEKVAKEREMLEKIFKSLAFSGEVATIEYGSEVRRISTFENFDFLSKEGTEGKTCLYDALKELETLVSEEYMKTKELETKRVKINRVEVIGIGTGKDNCSTISKEEGIDCFCKVASKPDVTTKYFCLTENNFMDVAEIGFRSIGAIFRNYL